MERYNLYDPEPFGMTGSPAYGESFVIAEKTDIDGNGTGEYVGLYICSDDPCVPPVADMDNPVELPDGFTIPGDTEPAFRNIGMENDGNIMFPDFGNGFVPDAVQRRLMVYPEYLMTENGMYCLEKNGIAFRKDESLDSIKPERLDMRKFNSSLTDRYPALLEYTHTSYGYRYPEFPNAKYFDNRDKMVVFMTSDQVRNISEDILDGYEPFYRDKQDGREWNVHNVYGVCIIDTSGSEYGISLISPYRLDIVRDRLMQADRKREKSVSKTEPQYSR